MTRYIKGALLFLMVLPLPAVSQNIDLGRVLQGSALQQLPINLGLRLDIDYGFQRRSFEYSAAGEVLFPVYRLLRCRATILQLKLSGTTLERIEFNTGVGLDLLIAITRAPTRLRPYGFLGGDLTLKGSNFDYGLSLGLGLEGRLRSAFSLFGELGFSHSYRQAQAADALLGRLGVRLGR